MDVAKTKLFALSDRDKASFTAMRVLTGGDHRERCVAVWSRSITRLMKCSKQSQGESQSQGTGAIERIQKTAGEFSIGKSSAVRDEKTDQS
jgi:hypothetical protein